MKYEIRFVDDATMPAGRDWMICQGDGVTVCALRESARSKSAEEAAAILEGAWAGFRAMVARGEMSDND